MGTKFSRWRPPNNRIFEKGTIFLGHPVYWNIHLRSIIVHKGINTLVPQVHNLNIISLLQNLQILVLL